MSRLAKDKAVPARAVRATLEERLQLGVGDGDPALEAREFILEIGSLLGDLLGGPGFLTFEDGKDDGDFLRRRHDRFFLGS